MIGIDEVLDRFKELGNDIKYNNKDNEKSIYRGVCPFHTGANNPSSFNLYHNNDDSIGFYCHSCNVDSSEVWNYLGINNKDYKEIDRSNKNLVKDYGNLTKYKYIDIRGNLLYYKNRLPNKSMFFSHIWKGKEYKGRGNYQSILYNLHNVVKSDTVLFTEGEKDADNLIKLGYVATTKDITKRGLYSSEIKTLKNKNLIIFYDNDESGISSKNNIIESVGGIVKSLKVVHLNIGEKGDISDWIEENKAEKKDIDKLIATAENIPTGKYRKLYDYYSYKEYITNLPKFPEEKVLQAEVLEYLTTHIPLIAVSGLPFIYDNGVYKELGTHSIRGVVQEHLKGKNLTANFRNSITSLWLSDLSVEVFPDQINQMLNKVNFKNGYYNLDTNQMEPHSHKELSTFQIQTEYNKDAKAPVFMEFIENAVPNHANRLLVQQMMGYALGNNARAKKAFILYGESNTGKSVLLNLLRDLIGMDNVSSVPFQDLGDRFSPARLYGKAANIHTDLPQYKISNLSPFLTLVGDGDETVDAEYKGKNGFSFKNKAKLLFATNHLPNFTIAPGKEVFNRLIIIPFNEVIEDHQIDIELGLKLREEFEGIANWAMEGLKDLHSKGYCFDMSEDSKKLIEQYKLSSPTELTKELLEEMSDYKLLQESIHYTVDSGGNIAIHFPSFWNAYKLYLDSSITREDRRNYITERTELRNLITQSNRCINTNANRRIGKSNKKCIIVEKHLKVI